MSKNHKRVCTTLIILNSFLFQLLQLLDVFQFLLFYGDFKDLTRRTASDNILRDIGFDIAKNPKYDGHQRGLASMVINFF